MVTAERLRSRRTAALGHTPPTAGGGQSRMHHAHRQRGLNGSWFGHQAVPASHSTCGPHRQCPRVVRLRRLRLLRQQYREPVLPDIRPDRRSVSDLGHVRAGILRPAHRKYRARARGRPNRPARAPHSVHFAHRWRHTDPGSAAHLRTDRAGRAAAADGDARDSGLFAGRRVHRIDGLHHRVVVAPHARPCQQLDGRGRHAGLHHGGRHRRHHQRHADPRSGKCLGLANSVCRQRRVPDHRLLPPPWHRRD